MKTTILQSRQDEILKLLNTWGINNNGVFITNVNYIPALDTYVFTTKYTISFELIQNLCQYCNENGFQFFIISMESYCNSIMVNEKPLSVIGKLSTIFENDGK